MLQFNDMAKIRKDRASVWEKKTFEKIAFIVCIIILKPESLEIFAWTKCLFNVG